MQEGHERWLSVELSSVQQDISNCTQSSASKAMLFPQYAAFKLRAVRQLLHQSSIIPACRKFAVKTVYVKKKQTISNFHAPLHYGR